MWKNNDWVHSSKSKTHCYLIDDGSEGRNAKTQKDTS